LTEDFLRITSGKLEQQSHKENLSDHFHLAD